MLFAATGMASAELQRFVSPPNPLRAQTQTVLRRLEALGTLDGTIWEWHPGDLAHGEEATENDGHWKPLGGKAKVGTGAVWFRASIHVPAESHGYSLTGAGLVMALNVSPGGRVPEILYLNGRRIALGKDLEPELLEPSLHAGEVLSVAVKLLSTTEDKTVLPPTLTLRFAPARPEPVRFRNECESAAVLLPTLDKDPGTLAVDLDRIAGAVAAVDLSALDHTQQAAFDASLRKAEALLDPLRPKLATLRIDAVGNSHIDAAWLWTSTETIEAVKNTWTSGLQLMAEYPAFQYAIADMQYIAWMENKYPAVFRALQAAAKTGRLDVVGGMWGEPDFNEPDGESMAREVLLGKRYVKAKFGIDVRIGWNVDSFGYSWQLPQVYKKSGIDYFVTQKENWNEDNRLPLKLFWWQSPDGSAVLTYFPMSYYGTTDPVQMAEELANARPLAPGLKTIMHLYGVGDHGGGPTRVELDEADAWIDHQRPYPTLDLSTPTKFFAEVAPKVTPLSRGPVWNYKTLAAGASSLAAAQGDGISIPVWRDELYLEFHRGTYTTQAAQKKNMRDSEEWMLDAEKLSSIAWSQGAMPYPQTVLNDAWKKVLFNTNHDLAAGSGIGAIYKDAQVDYTAVHAATSAISSEAADWMEAHANTSLQDPLHEAPVVVFNTLGWARGGLFTVDVQMPQALAPAYLVVRDADGHALPSQVLSSDAGTERYRLLVEADRVPAVGFAVLHVAAGTSRPQTDLRVEGVTLENALLRVVIDPKSGCITHLVDRRTSFDSIADGGCGNQLQTFVDKPKKYDAWNIDASALAHMTPIAAADSVEVVDKGPVRASIRIRRHWGHSTFEQIVVLYSGLDRVDIENHIDWHETHVLLKAAFPLRASSDQATYEIPYGTIERPTTRSNPIDAAKYEVPALRWADLGDSAHGLSLINNSKYGYDATPHLLRLSLLRSPVYPDPEADRGMQTFTFSLYPHAGTWQQALTERRGYEFNYGLSAHQVSEHAGALGTSHSYVSFDDTSAVMTALKKSEDGSALILRAFDWSGKASDAVVHLPPGATRASEADILENAIGPALPLTKDVLHVTLHPYEIKTIRIEYPQPASDSLNTVQQ
jgi:alpha-mannosidase